jgi:FkbM family methyltransferase
MSFIAKATRRIAGEFRLLGMRISSRIVLNQRSYLIRQFQTSGLLRAASRHDDYEPGHDAVMARILAERKGAFIDVGANVGQTLLKLLKIDPARDYVGFEPQLSSALCVENFIHDNGLNNHTILAVGLSDSDSVMKFGVRFENDTTASSNLDARPKEFYKYHFTVPARKGDTVLADLGVKEVAMLKIDVEGAEIQVLTGFAETIRSAKPVVVFECLPKILLTTKQRLPEDIIELRCKNNKLISQFFRNAGYDLFEIKPDETGTMVAVEAISAAEAQIKNYIAIPKA